MQPLPTKPSDIARNLRRQQQTDNRPLSIGLDFDETFSADETFWTAFCELAEKHGHFVHCISSRQPTPEKHREIRAALPQQVEKIICCGNQEKRVAANTAGLRVDIWIDDRPHTIGNTD